MRSCQGALVDDVQREAIHRLYSRWSNWHEPRTYRFYVELLLPEVVVRGEAALSEDGERAALRDLRAVLSPTEWAELPRILGEHHGWLGAAQERADQEKQRLQQQAIREATLREAELRAKEQAEALAASERRKRSAEATRSRELHIQSVLGPVMRELPAVLENDFIGAWNWFSERTADIPTGTRFADTQRAFVQSWCQKSLKLTVDAEQADAIAAVRGHTLLAARAGSGKTRTLTARAAFLIRHCKVPAPHVMLLAFNTKAAGEIRQRLATMLTPEQMPFVMTFHALAYALVRPHETLVYDDEEAGNWSRRDLVEAAVQTTLTGPSAAPVQELVLNYFRNDMLRGLVGLDADVAARLEIRRGLARETLRGEYVKSHGEKVLANLLFENGITYQYEKTFYFDQTPYRPDFTISHANRDVAIIEYYGLNNPEYNEQRAAKRQYWTRKGIPCLELTPWEVTDQHRDATEVRILEVLRPVGATPRRLSDDELWDQIKERARTALALSLSQFVERCRQRAWDPAAAEAEVLKHRVTCDEEAQYLHLALLVLSHYEASLKSSGAEDFAGLMRRATTVVDGGGTRFERSRGQEIGDVANLSFLLIDEFQDFSDAFAALVDAMISASPRLNLFAVGDDWQAINEFAGSRSTHFQTFTVRHKSGRLHHLTTNYRSAASIVALGNAIMHGHGQTATSLSKSPGLIQQADPQTLTLDTLEADAALDRTSALVLRLAREHFRVSGAEDIAVLTRTKNEAAGLRRALRTALPELHDRVDVDTTHGFKGREASTVVVLNAHSSKYPLIHPMWIFGRIFGDSLASLEQADRRLFYVAASRASHRLIFVVVPSEVSPFLDELRRPPRGAGFTLSTLRPEQLPSAVLGSEGVIVVSVRGYGVRGLLQADGFRFDGSTKLWSRVFERTELTPDQLRQCPWYELAEEVIVRSASDGHELHRR